MKVYVHPIKHLGRLAVLLVIATFALATGLALAQTTGTGYTMTLVARECTQYTDIMANRARNNIQESLEDLGKDSVYTNGEPISPTIENANNNCIPMAVPWTFTLGRSIAGATSGSWGRLSYVGGVFRSVTTTVAGVPELNPAGNPTGGTVPSAVTIELTAAELAQTSSRLWVQGGTPPPPGSGVLNGLQNDYGFGALRCAIDNLNGDNVEWNGYPSGSKHIFCYAYYVKPPPTSGTIIVVKQNNGEIKTDFVFRGNISYSPDPDNPGDSNNFFTLSPNPNGGTASQTFYRAGGSTWDVREDLPDGWRLTSESCISTGIGGSTVTTNPIGGFSIALAANDVVTCTFVDDIDPPTAGLVVLKYSGDGDPQNGIEAVGAFPMSVTPTSPPVTGTATTIVEGEPAFGVLAPNLTAGTYTISETWPANDPLGTWGLDPTTPVACVTCLNGACALISPPPTPMVSGNGASFSLTMPNPPITTVCAFNNRLSYTGQLQIGKLATNRSGDFLFDVSRRGNPTFDYSELVEATTPGVPTYNSPKQQLPWGDYQIVETNSNPGNWTLQRVQCFDQPVPSTAPPFLDSTPQGDVDVTVTLSPSRPFIRCLFTNEAQTGQLSSTSIPTLSEWALMLFSLFLGGLIWRQGARWRSS
ncbi:MAG: IPTL-CTERM sorting domain-containing protein [Candidatus Competibacteraceae bacterium]